MHFLPPAGAQLDRLNLSDCRSEQGCFSEPYKFLLIWKLFLLSSQTGICQRDLSSTELSPGWPTVKIFGAGWAVAKTRQWWADSLSWARVRRPDSHLNEEIDSESPLWSAAAELCHSFQMCCCQLALKKTHFQPTWATGLRHPCSSKLAASLLEREQGRKKERKRSCQLDSWSKRERLLNG